MARVTRLFFYACVAAQLAPAFAYAATPEEQARARRLFLARQFIEKIAPGLQKADEAIAALSPDDVRKQNYFNAIPDGEPLLLGISLIDPDQRGRLAKIPVEQDISAIKEGRDVMISLSDFVSAARFPIKIHPDGTASGWFIREDRRFELDFQKKTLAVDKKQFSFSGADARLENEDILVKGAVLARWFNFNMTANMSSQSLDITTPKTDKWPVQEQAARIQRAREPKLRPKAAEKPFQSQSYKIASVPNADVSIRKEWAQSKDGVTTTRDNYTVQATGDLAGFTGQTTLNTQSPTEIQSLSVNLSKKSEDPILLGPLRARRYELNDLQTTPVPFSGFGGAERGIRVSNKLSSTTYNTSTQIDGLAPPGWDVELFRGDQYIDGQTADLNGRYIFHNIDLFAGVNQFRVFLYGPRGETRQEEKSFTVAAGAENGGYLYDASLSQQNTQTYAEQESRDQDKDTLRFAGTVEKQINEKLAWREGLSIAQEEGVDAAYLHSGAVMLLNKDLVLNADSLLSAEGPFMAAVTGRQNFGQQKVSASASYQSANFHPGIQLPIDTPGALSSSVSVTGPLRWADWLDWRSRWKKRPRNSNRGSYLAQTGFRYTDSGLLTTTAGLTVSGQAFGLRLSNVLRYGITSNQTQSSESPDHLDGALSVGGRAFQTSWRGSLSYTALPSFAANKFTLGAQRSLARDLRADFEASHRLDRDLTTLTSSLSWRREKETISPSISYDSNENIGLTVQVRFGLTVDPYTGKIIRKGAGMGTTGGISALVFLDKDGDGVMSEGDEPIPDATVESVQNSLRGETDEKGETFIYGVPTGTVTDVVLEENSLFEPNWVVGFEGVSIRPRPGLVTKLTFPVWRGGELDGTAYIRMANGANRPLRDTRLHLFKEDGLKALTVTTEADGYYLFERIPPGRYLLLAESHDLKDSRVMPALPVPFAFTFEGTQLLGRDLYFTEGATDAALEINPQMSDYLDANKDLRAPLPVSAPGQGTVLLNLGSFHSRLLATLTWYKVKMNNPGLVAGLTPLVKPGRVHNSATTGLHTLRVALPGAGMDEGYARCLALSNAGQPCTVEYFPNGLPGDNQASDKPKKDKKA